MTKRYLARVVVAVAVGGTAVRGGVISATENLSQAAESIQSGDVIAIEVPGKVIRIRRAEWKPMTNEFEWAENFEQIKRRPRHEFSRVVTIYKIPMSVDRRIGTKISSNEYVEIFTGLPQLITVRVRVDKGLYWVMSRETFRVPSSRDTEFHDPILAGIIADRAIDDDEHAQAHLALQPEIDTTRYLLQQEF